MLRIMWKYTSKLFGSLKKLKGKTKLFGKYMKYLCCLLLTVIASAAAAGGWTNNGVLENVEVVRSQGFMMKGALGDAADCGSDGYLWVPIDHPQYDLLYSTALAAFMGAKKIHAYAHTCTEIGWHGGSFSTLSGAGALYIKH